MSIAINKDKCIGCKKCLSVCPGSLIKSSEDGKVYIKYPKDCWGCSSCIKECPKRAISLYLGADIGGRGSRLTVKLEKDIVHWNIEESDGTEHSIDINRKDSNKY
ncbi:4Fe-4S dicluster domain-containing protein [Clostridium saccharobutylicum]|uniref:4Fe-4S ferredoxin iron-sulfur binding domain-containing protein n=1 Tax=Clostridium saccharobutylicum DSM 13864 TaxID=1345695 RepID=U5MVN4_CLOSA|nr:ferredoxin family protein [Clostridium saccharobutylicum]AGX44854.1 4Fe-4S ferredoxin iron-sulfur binding domain-containing protein [Clostridium saccharobutylicum DSM 13864]AQR92136.1 ferredoxin-2 [Clostridium saccharobutylicum]AQS02038.1 ferredoxin-2 [Clostridium saccharobutylicum]AQS11642.1 ferredoxin-2 [Clostridium saccharobutylicum]AQS16021.1 ferredoxin-2 [Clostridium saccharobutylicum]